MALRWIEGFETYSTLGQDASSIMTRKYPTVVGTGFSLVAGRTGGLGLQLPGSFNSNFGTPIFTSQDTWIVGFGYQIVDVSDTRILSFYDTASTQIELRRDNANLLYVTRNGTFLASGDFNLLPSTWYYIEIKGLIDPTVGSIEVVINGVSDFIFNGNTRTTANSSANKFFFHSDGNLASKLDDIYICDDTGSFNNDFLGDNRVEVLIPNAVGATTEWTPLAGDNYTQVDEIPADDDTSYVSSDVADEIDTYGYTNLSAVKSNVKGLQVNILSRKDDAGSINIAPVVNSGGTDFVGDTIAVTDTYTFNTQVYETDPNTSALWEVADVNSAQFGQQVKI